MLYLAVKIKTSTIYQPSALEICAGGGGQALGLELAGFNHNELIEIEPLACETLRLNRPSWQVTQTDLRSFNADQYIGIDLLAGGVPCPPFSIAGQQLGADDERDLFPAAIRLVSQCRPRLLMLENVRGILSPRFAAYRDSIDNQLHALGYRTGWALLQASSFGVSQLRPRVVLVGIANDRWEHFRWPMPNPVPPPSVGDLLADLMGAKGWQACSAWRKKAQGIAPTLVGGSKKHGGADLGPSRARQAWAALGVDGSGLANEAPDEDFEGNPKLTLRMTARLQGFPDTWTFAGRKTAAYRQVGNAFPPPVAYALGLQMRKALEATKVFSL